MSLAPGAQLDHYEIVSVLGTGGMGEVYRARDTRLPREVAIKVSTVAFNDRFAREARVIAALNHPNICTLFDVGPNYLVMELVDGDTLQDRIKQGAISLDEASRIARQIAEALDYAHEHGIIHRDLKPANIKVRPDGVVKVLDFGLAKAMQTANPDEVSTMTMDATQAGAILGTPNYMSPEQAMGRPTDKRADTWAFGIVFYEMLSGEKPFGGPTIQESIASTLRDAPDLNKVPTQVRRLLRKCLEKDPANRLRHLGDVMSLVDEPPSGVFPPGTVAAPVGGVNGRNWLWPALAGVGVLAAAVVSWIHFREQPPANEPISFEIALPKDAVLSRYGVFSISPDGRNIVFAASDAQGTRWWLRKLNSSTASPISPPLGPAVFAPFWSPDSRFIGYSNNEKVWKLEVAGGQPQQLCDKCTALGGSWAPDGSILIGNLSSISKIPAAGGAPEILVTANRKGSGVPEAAVHPLWLPDGKRFLYLYATGSGSQRKFGIRVGSVEAKPEAQSTDWLMKTAAAVTLLPAADGQPAQLLYMNGTTLMARPFDPGKPALAGEPRQVIEQLGGVGDLAWASYSVSSNGRIVYRTVVPSTQQRLTWFDREGNKLESTGEPASMNYIALSPDGRRAAMAIRTGDQDDIWVADLAAGTRTRLTYETSSEALPVWSRDGLSIAYVANPEGKMGIYRRAANGLGNEELIYKTAYAGSPNISDWSADGKLFFHATVKPERAMDILALALKPGSEPTPVVETPFREVAAKLSPDGRYFLYVSNESGRGESYVQAVPGGGAPAGKWIVSKEGSVGMNRWRRDGRELFFLSPEGTVMAADVTSLNPFASGAPHKLFDLPVSFRPFIDTGLPGTHLDVSADGQRFLLSLPVVDETPPVLLVNTDWRLGLAK